MGASASPIPTRRIKAGFIAVLRNEQRTRLKGRSNNRAPWLSSDPGHARQAQFVARCVVSPALAILRSVAICWPVVEVDNCRRNRVMRAFITISCLVVIVLECHPHANAQSNSTLVADYSPYLNGK